ncbi:hypothetical protein [Casimicrobium huifangae]|uniref:hypothetical protein n=1 Tax=Casimicrobium huifangae TaxID=2591109 RepID=UPI0037852A42
MAAKLVARLHRDVGGRRGVRERLALRIGVGVVLDVGDPGGDLLSIHRARHVALLAGLRRGARPRWRLGLVAAVQPFEVGGLLVRFRLLVEALAGVGFGLVEDFSFDHVAGAAHRRIGDRRAVCRCDVHRVLHREGDDIFVRAEHGFRVGHLEVAGEARLGTQTFGRHAVAGEAGDAVAAEGAVSGVGASGGDEVGVSEEGVRLVGQQLPLAHDAVAGVAGVVDFLCDRGIGQRFRFALRLKDRVAAGMPPSSERAPFAKG